MTLGRGGGEAVNDEIMHNSFIVADSSEAALKEATDVILSMVSLPDWKVLCKWDWVGQLKAGPFSPVCAI